MKYSPEQLAQELAHILGVTDEVAPLSGAVRKPTGINDEILAHDSPPADFTGVVQGCGAVRWAADPNNQPKVSRDYWRGLLGIVKHCEGAHDLAHEVSKHHPEYTPNETDRELEGWTVPPTTCEFFSRHDDKNGGACTNCPHGTGGAA